jgi:hypothetical protein
MISPSGALREIPLTTKGPVVPTEPPCDSAAHNINSAIIALRNPERITKAYIGYSEFYWSPKTRERYKKACQPRLIEFMPAEWMKSQAQENAAMVEDVEKSVLEYAPLNLTKYLKAGYFEYKSRAGQAAKLSERMERINPGKGLILAVPDPIGCVSELNSFRMHALADYHAYIHDPETAWKNSCAMQIEGLRSLEKKAVEESLKDAKTDYVPVGDIDIRRVSKDEQIEEEIESRMARLEEHYSEKKRKSFLLEYKRTCKRHEDHILLLDRDYISWQDSMTLAVAVDDCDPHSDAEVAVEIRDRILSGGAISKASLQYWEEMTKREAADLRNYAISGILMNREDWARKFHNADEKNLAEYIWGDNKGKLFDIGKNAAESGELEGANNLVNQNVNRAAAHAANILVTANGSLMAIIAEKARSASETLDEATKDAITKLERLQGKLGLAFARIHTETDIAIVKIDLTLDEWHRLMTLQLKRSITGISREASRGLSAMAVTAQLRLPENSAVAKKVLPFTFWMSGKPDEILRIIDAAANDISGATVRTAKSAIKAGAAAAGEVGKAVTSAGQDAVRETVNGVRTIRVIGASFSSGTAKLAQISRQISGTAAAQIAQRITRQGMSALASGEVKLMSVALVFQLYALQKSIREFNNSAGAKSQELIWAISSAAFGVTGATVELAGKSWRAISPNTSFSVGGVRIVPLTVIKSGGLLGTVASAIECVQSLLKANTYAKCGDRDAAFVQIGAAIAAGVGVYFGAKVAFGSVALFGPVGIVILCAAAGLALGFAAFYVQDTAIDIWLDRCKFGNGIRTEGRFRSARLEADGLELVYRSVIIQLEWLDTPLNIGTDEIAISVKRRSNGRDAVLVGLFVEGPAGRRQVFIRRQGISGDGVKLDAPFPRKLLGMTDATASMGERFEARVLNRKSGVYVEKEDGKTNIAWEERVLINSEKFERATVWVRYFPDKADQSLYYDEQLTVQDSSSLF